MGLTNLKPAMIIVAALSCVVFPPSWGHSQDANLGSFNTANSPIPQGSRTLGIALSTASDNDYDAATLLAKSVGMDATPVSFNWEDLEPASGVYQNDLLKLADLYFPAMDTKVGLSIRPLDTNGKHVPPDLIDTPYDDPVLIRRFKVLIDHVFSQIPNLDLIYLSIGNEIDIALADNSLRWEQYTVFYEEILAHIRLTHPRLKLGTSASLYGLVGFADDELNRINRGSDVVLATYYPLHADFTVKSPKVVHGDIESLLAIYPIKEIYFSDVGYPTSARLKSSQKQQASFVRNVFKVWDRYPQRIPHITFLTLTDVSQDETHAFSEYYGISRINFRAFLKTLGLRKRKGSGVDKSGFRTLKEAVTERGWVN